MVGEFIEQKLSHVTNQSLFPPKKASLPAYHRGKTWEIVWMVTEVFTNSKFLCWVRRGDLCPRRYHPIHSHISISKDERRVPCGAPGVLTLTDFPFTSLTHCNSQNSLDCEWQKPNSNYLEQKEAFI